jgi:hypothetical protein
MPMKNLLFFPLLLIAVTGDGEHGVRANTLSCLSERPDTTDEIVRQAPLQRKHWATLDLMIGRQSFSNDWEPYAATTFVALSSQVRMDSLFLWLDGSIVVAWAGETTAEGYPATPGSSFVELHNGVGHWWYPEHLPFSYYAGAGFTYTWASLELPDMSQPPLPISEFLRRPVYPTMQASGHFWGGYLRCGLVFHPEKTWYFGVGTLVMLTTHRYLLDRKLDVTSNAFGFFAGAGI